MAMSDIAHVSVVPTKSLRSCDEDTPDATLQAHDHRPDT